MRGVVSKRFFLVRVRVRVYVSAYQPVLGPHLGGLLL